MPCWKLAMLPVLITGALGVVTVPTSVLKRRRRRTAPELRGVIVVWGVDMPRVAAVSLLIEGGTAQRGVRCLWACNCSPRHLCDLFFELCFFFMWVRDPLYMFSIAPRSELAVAKSTVEVAYPRLFFPRSGCLPFVGLGIFL